MVLETVPRQVQSEPLLSLSYLRTRIPAEFQGQFCEDTRICLDCGASIILQDDELCCSRCGRVWSEAVSVEDDRIPLEEGNVGKAHAEANYSPGSELAFGHGLGAGLDGRGLFRILAQGKNGPTDLPLRAMQIRLITKRYDHPTTETFLSYGSKFMNDYGMHTNDEENVVFANLLGKQLRKIAAFCVVRGERNLDGRRIAAAVFYNLFVQKNPAEAQKLFEEMNLTPELTRYVETMLNVLEPPPRAKRKRKQD